MFIFNMSSETCIEKNENIINDYQMVSNESCQNLTDVLESDDKRIENKNNDIYLDNLIKNDEDEIDKKHVEELLDIDSEKNTGNDIKQTLEYLKTMKDVAAANNISLKDFSDLLFNSKSVKVESVSPKSSLKKKLAESKNSRRSKYATLVRQNKKKVITKPNIPSNADICTK